MIRLPFPFSLVNSPEQEQTVRLALMAQPAKVVVSRVGRQDLPENTIYGLKSVFPVLQVFFLSYSSIENTIFGCSKTGRMVIKP